MATSKLQIAVGNLLDSVFPEYRIRENYRPDWLVSSNITKLELDFYIEELKIAFEVQGDQHFKFIPFFHRTYDDFEKRKQYDQEKKDLCDGAGVKLIELCTYLDAEIEIDKIKEAISPPILIHPSTEIKATRNRIVTEKHAKQPPTPEELQKLLFDQSPEGKLENLGKEKAKLQEDYNKSSSANKQLLIELSRLSLRLKTLQAEYTEFRKTVYMGIMDDSENKIKVQAFGVYIDELKKWERKAIKRGGYVKFESIVLTNEMIDRVTKGLMICKTPEDIKSVFQEVIEDRQMNFNT